MIYQCRRWVNGTQCELPEGHNGVHRLHFPSGNAFQWADPCEMCGGKRWLSAADVYKPVGEESQVDWELAATVPCPRCTLGEAS